MSNHLLRSLVMTCLMFFQSANAAWQVHLGNWGVATFAGIVAIGIAVAWGRSISEDPA